MTRALARAAVAAFLDPSAVPGLVSIWPAMPLRIEDFAYDGGSGDQWGAVAYLHIDASNEKRLAMGMPGTKIVAHHFGMVVRSRSYEQDGVAAAGHNDDVVNAIVSRLRSDRTLGTAGHSYSVLLAADGPPSPSGEPDSNPDVEVVTDLPSMYENTILHLNLVKFRVLEEVSG